MDIAIVGAGPRGLAAVYSLGREVEGAIRIHLFGAVEEGEDVLGIGTPYSPKQPEFSRLNAHSSILDLFGAYRHTDLPVGLTFDEWARAENHGELANNYPPRAFVGRYFHYCADFVRQTLPSHIKVHEYGRALAITGEPGAWTIAHAQGEITVPELLLTVGHASSPASPLTDEDVNQPAGTVIPIAYPLHNLAGIDAGSTVATRGAGLTFVDVVLSLTEGRGGQFSDDGRTYTPSGREPECIWATNIDGIFPDSKPPHRAVHDLLPDERWETAKAAVAQSTTLSEMLETIRSIALEAMAMQGNTDPDMYRKAMSSPQPAPGLAVDRLTESIAAARREIPLPARQVATETWQELMPAIIRRVSNRIFSSEEWGQFTALYAVVADSSYGPPLINAQKVLTLVEQGLIKIELLDQAIDAEKFPFEVDAFVDCVLPPAGIWPGAYEELAEIENYLLLWAGQNVERSGVRIDDSGSVLDGNEAPIKGLAAVGRMNEDWSIDMDNLNVTDHPFILGWAKRIARAVADPA